MSPREIVAATSDVFLSGAGHALSSLHSLGLPWYVVIPATAALVRGVLVYNIATKPLRKAAQIRSQLVPLASAEAHALIMANQKLHIRAIRSGNITEKRQSLHRWRYAPTMAYLVRLWKDSKDHNAPILSWRSPVNFGILILFTEAVRMKCNARGGLWSLITAPFTGNWLGAKEPRKSMEDELLEWLQKKKEAEALAAQTSDGSSVMTAGTNTLEAQAPSVSSALPSAEAGSFYDPTMALEGLPWCVDLTVPDSTFILPGVLGAALFANVLLRRVKLLQQSPLATEKMAREVSLLDRPLNLGERVSLSVGLLLSLVSTQWPAAIVLYFTSNVIVGWLQQRWLDRTMPILPPIRPSKRPVRLSRPPLWQQESKVIH